MVNKAKEHSAKDTFPGRSKRPLKLQGGVERSTESLAFNDLIESYESIYPDPAYPDDIFLGPHQHGIEHRRTGKKIEIVKEFFEKHGGCAN